MLVFQVLLFAGYAYAHLTTEYLKPRHQIALHMLLLVAAIAMLPIAPDVSWKPTNSDTPALRIMLLILACIGLPYFLLSATGPLVQCWFSRTHSGRSPYRLYALSNIGSLLALISYPFAFEPIFSVHTQSRIWSIAFAIFAGLCAFSGFRMGRKSGSPVGNLAFDQPVFAATSPPMDRPTSGLTGLWFLFAMTPSLLLLASTNQVCMDVAVIPFLWVLPLALYLLSFILCFDSDRWYSRRRFLVPTFASQLAAVYLATSGPSVPIVWQIATYFGALFCCCMTCHGELAALKPHPRFLTLYFLTISAGGAAGGLFVGLLAPILFVNYSELQVGILCFMIAFVCLRLREDRIALPIPNWGRTVAVAVILAIAVVGLAQASKHQSGSIAASRNFYGVLKVTQSHNPAKSISPLLELAHGRITHGTQFIEPALHRTPTAYYAPNTGIGRLMQSASDRLSRRVGIVGLGVGTLAAYGNIGDYFRMYEINPDVITTAQKYFTFLSDSPADQTIVTGDARLSLEFEPPQNFDILVLDAFSGDAIPVHLLTREAMLVYLKHLSHDGILACHISNLHFNLRPVIAGLAQDQGLSHRFIGSAADTQTAAQPAIWAMLARSPETLVNIDQLQNPFFADYPRSEPSPSEASVQNQYQPDLMSTSQPALTRQPAAQRSIERPITWTDARSNLLDVMW